MDDLQKKLKTCAYCPNTCRPSHPAGATMQLESATPSAMSLVVLGLIDGRLRMDDATRAVLSRREALVESVGHCTYGLDMVAVIDAALASGKTGH